MKNTVNLNSINIICADSLQYIKTLPDDCIDLIATDPPYFRVKSCKWDNQWPDESAYLAWLDEMFAEFWRVLKPAGSLYVFCGSRLAADTELLMRERFKILSHIIWAKPSGPWNLQHKEDLRAYFPATERILFAEHYSGPYNGKASSYSVKCQEQRKNTLKPLVDYFSNARKALGITSKEIHQATGKQMASHWFSESQWQLPSEIDYLALQGLFEQVAREKHTRQELDHPHHQLIEEYHSLSRQYAELVDEHKRLRRPFTVSSAVPFTDVWTYKSVPYYASKHPCEKPAEMMRDIINASSRPGDVVADFFMGSGSTIKEAIKLGRFALGVELEEERYNQTLEEIFSKN